MNKLKMATCCLLASACIAGMAGCGANGGAKVDQNKNTVATISSGVTAPSATVDVLRIGSDCQSSIVSTMVLQGVINKKQPRVYIYGMDGSNYEVPRYQMLQKEEGITLNALESDKVSAHKGYAAFWTLFKKYHDEIKSIYIFDDDQSISDSINVAAMLAGRNHGVAVDHTLFEALAAEGYAKGREVVDVCEKYGFDLSVGNVGINKWIRDNMVKGSNREFVCVLSTHPRDSQGGLAYPKLYDLAVASDALIYHFDVDFDSQIALQKEILDQFDDNTIVIGWPGVGVEEAYIRSVSACNKEAVCADWFFANGSFLSGFENFKHKEKLYSTSTDKSVLSDKVYVSFLVSDGDAWHYAMREFLSYWGSSVRGTVPIGWSIPSLFSEFNPLWMKKIYGEATELDEIIQGVAGVTYVQPKHMSDTAFEQWCWDTKNSIAEVGISTVNYWDVGVDAYNADNARLKKYCEIVKPDAVYMGHAEQDNNYFMIGDTVCMTSLGATGIRGTQTKEEVIAAVDRSVARTEAGKPVFVNVNIEAWGQGVSTVASTIDELMTRVDGWKYEFVLPYEMANLIRSYEKNGASGVTPEEDKRTLTSMQILPFTDEETAIITNNGSGRGGSGNRFGDGHASWVYRFDVGASDILKMTLTLDGGYKVSVSLDNQTWITAAERLTTSGKAVVSFDVAKLLGTATQPFYVKFEDSTPDTGFGASLFETNLIYR